MVPALVSEARLHLERLFERKIASLLGRGIELHDLVGFGEGEAEHAADVADRLLSLDGAEGDYLRDPIVAILFADVIEHLIAALEAEIGIDIGHRLAPRIEPSLEQQLVLDRI